jgi:hypothetical protein
MIDSSLPKDTAFEIDFFQKPEPMNHFLSNPSCKTSLSFIEEVIPHKLIDASMYFPNT